MEFRFASRRPAGLERYVESVWYARGRIDYPDERIAPTGSVVAVVVLGDPIRETPADGTGESLVAETGFLLGPHDRPVVNEPLGETHCVGIVTTPVGCEAVFGVRPATIRGRVVDLQTAWPEAEPLRRRLLDRIGGTPDDLLDLVTATLTPTLTAGTRPRDTGRCERAVAALEADPAQSIGALAAELGLSHGHLDHEFTEIVGLSPRVLARILRLRVLLARLDVYAPVPWSALAAELGWFDQSHFIRDFKRHTGVTPSDYVVAQRRSFTPDQAAPGFVPRR